MRWDEVVCNIYQNKIQNLTSPVDEVNRNSRGGSRAAVTSKMERFVIIVNGWKPLTIITKRSILDVAAALDPPLNSVLKRK